MLQRRTVLAGLCALTASSFGRSAFGSTDIQLGDGRIDVVSDGQLQLPGSFLFDGLPEDELKEILARYNVSAEGVTPPCNLTLFRHGDRTVLFDVGSGPNFMPTAGKVIDALEAIDVDVSDVTDVVFTHAHPDHLWGILDDFDEPLFSEARYHISSAEWDYWMDPDTVNTIGEARQAFAAGAKRMLAAVEDMVERFDDGADLLPGVTARSTAGHTPGHMSFILDGGNETAMVVGDAIGNHHIAFEKPEWEVFSDQDREMGAETRTGLLDQLAADRTQLIGFHLPYPGIGYVERKGEAYRFAATSS